MRPIKGKSKINKALKVIKCLGMPDAQHNERSALSLLAMLNITPRKKWREATAPLMGITPIMDWIRTNYGKNYAPNTRETIRRQTMHQFVAAGIVLYNPDKPDRPVNSPKAVYQIAPDALKLLQCVEASNWNAMISDYLESHKGLAAAYAKERSQTLIPVNIAPKKKLHLSPGEHSELIRDIIEQFATRFCAWVPVSLCNGISGPRSYGTIHRSNRMGNRSMDCKCAIPFDSLQRQPFSGALLNVVLGRRNHLSPRTGEARDGRFPIVISRPDGAPLLQPAYGK
jgi:hypothetical protein